MTAKIKAICFDSGNVIVSFNKMIACRRIERFLPFAECNKNNIKAKDIYNRLFDNEAEKIRQRDLQSGQKLYEYCCAQGPNGFGMNPELVDYELFGVMWGNIFKENRIIRSVVRRVREYNIPIFVLSNAEELHFPYVLRVIRAANIPEQNVMASFMIGTRKPEPEYLEQAILLTGCEPENILYVGDEAEIVMGFVSYGVDGILYTPDFKWNNRFFNRLENNALIYPA